MGITREQLTKICCTRLLHMHLRLLGHSKVKPCLWPGLVLLQSKDCTLENRRVPQLLPSTYNYINSCSQLDPFLDKIINNVCTNPQMKSKILKFEENIFKHLVEIWNMFNIDRFGGRQYVGYVIQSLIHTFPLAFCLNAFNGKHRELFR